MSWSAHRSSHGSMSGRENEVGVVLPIRFWKATKRTNEFWSWSTGQQRKE